jgi:hypothetical protein
VAPSCKRCWSEKNKYYIFWVCVCGLKYSACNAHAPCYTVICGRLYNIFPYYLINMFFQKELFNIKYAFWFSLQILSETFLILRRNEREMITHLCWSSCKVPAILARFSWKLNFLDKFSEKTEICTQTFMKPHPVGAELFHADWWTDGHEANSRSSQFFERA